MQATTTKRERKPLARSCNITTRPDGLFLLELSVQKSRKTTQVDYYIGHQVEAGFGIGFKLEKQDAVDLTNEAPLETYHVNLGGLDGHDYCECRGFGVAKKGPCKHVAAIKACIASGRLTPRPSEADMERIEEKAAAIDAEPPEEDTPDTDEEYDDGYDQAQAEWAQAEACCDGPYGQGY